MNEYLSATVLFLHVYFEPAFQEIETAFVNDIISLSQSGSIELSEG